MQAARLVDLFGGPDAAQVKVSLSYRGQYFEARDASLTIPPDDSEDEYGEPRPFYVQILSEICNAWANSCAARGSFEWVPLIVPSANPRINLDYRFGLTSNVDPNKQAILKSAAPKIVPVGANWTLSELDLVQDALKEVLEARVAPFACYIASVFTIEKLD
jgi:hypothetical protein